MDERLGLLDELRAARCTVSILTTYSIDFQFYETVVLRKLNAAGCEHHLLLVDAVRCGESLADPERRPKLAGISYALVPVTRAGAFHPKVIILAGKKSSRLFVGSHNVTFAGFGGNAEITNALDGGRSSPETALLTDALEAIQSWVGEPSSAAKDILDAARALVGPMKARSDVTASLLYSATGRPPLVEQLRPHIPKKPRRVIIAGPFFDDGLHFIRQAKADLRAEEFIVAIDPTYAMLKAGAARKTGARFVDARSSLAGVGFAASSAMHAKMMLIEADDGAVLASGSANPSAAAWLRSDTNSEAVVVRRVSSEDLVRLGLADLAQAPEMTTAQWAELEDRVSAEANTEPAATPRAFVAEEENGRLVICGVERRPTEVRLHFADERAAQSATFSYEPGVVTVAGAPDDLSICNLVEVFGKFAGIAAVNHSMTLTPRGGRGSAQTDLRAALGAVTDDPSRIDEVLQIVERAIEEVDDVDGATILRRAAQSAAPEAGADPLGPRAMKLEDVRRRHARPRSVASGDIAVVIDLLIRRIAEGLPQSSPMEPPREVDESELDPLEEVARIASTAVDGNRLVAACHRKIRRLLRRMGDRLDHVIEKATGATRATIQLAAVLGVVRWLRRLERQLPWLPFGESLIPDDAREDLFWRSAMYLGVSHPSLTELALSEVDEPFDEMAIALGLVAWLGREAEIDARTLARHPDEDELDAFHWVGLLVMLMRRVVADDAATATLTNAVADSRGADREGWLATHVHLGEALSHALVDTGKCAQRPPVRGDLVRINMPNGTTGVGYVVDLDDTKVRLLDDEHEDGRPVLRKYVAPIQLP